MHSFLVAGGHRLETLQIHPERSDRPWLVFLHEGLGSIALWRDFPQALCDAANCRGLVYSRYGYGRSEPLAAPRTVDFMHVEATEVLPEILEQLGIRNPILFGHSDGGSIALIHAAAFPERVAGAVLLAPHILVEDVSIASSAAAREAYGSNGLRDKLARYHDDPDSAFRGWNDIWLDPAFRSWNIEPLLARIRCPLLAIQGGKDEYGTMRQIDGIAANARQTSVSLRKLADCGHAPHRDQPQAVIDATTGFIGQLQRHNNEIHL
jgi:pimeloyl-ACP methyl ester carboxylesterase